MHDIVLKEQLATIEEAIARIEQFTTEVPDLKSQKHLRTLTKNLRLNITVGHSLARVMRMTTQAKAASAGQ
jgi:hypothetical protein